MRLWYQHLLECYAKAMTCYGIEDYGDSLDTLIKTQLIFAIYFSFSSSSFIYMIYMVNIYENLRVCKLRLFSSIRLR